MWIKWRTLDGVESVTPAGGVNGLEVRTGEDVQRLLDALNGQITGSELNTELSAVIDDSMMGIKYLSTQYGMRVQVAADGKKLVGGYGLMGTNSAERGPSIDFGVLANRFYVGAPAEDGGISSTRPFIVQTTPTVINGVSVPAGVYIEDGFIKNGTITNAKIANAAIDDAKIAFLSANKIRAGAISVGQDISSSTFSEGGAQGWVIRGDGRAEFREAVVRGGVFASYGQIAGININANGLYTSAYGSGTGFWLGKDGRVSLGNKLTWNGSQLTINGDGTFSGALNAASGTFNGALQAATGTFSGTLTADAINAVDTLNVRGGAITSMAYGTGDYVITPPGGRAVIASCLIQMPQGASGVVVTGITTFTSSSRADAHFRLERRGVGPIQAGFTWGGCEGGWHENVAVTGFDAPPAGNHWYDFVCVSPTSAPSPNRQIECRFASITAIGGKR